MVNTPHCPPPVHTAWRASAGPEGSSTVPQDRGRRGLHPSRSRTFRTSARPCPSERPAEPTRRSMIQRSLPGPFPAARSSPGAAGYESVAVSAKNEAYPGPHWGLGEEAPLVRGHTSNIPDVSDFSGERLIKLSGGNARLVRMAAQLDGRVAPFGRSFWKVLAAADPILAASMQEHGIHTVIYSDRYLLTPLNVRLLSEILRQVPKGKIESLKISTARASRSKSAG